MMVDDQNNPDRLDRFVMAQAGRYEVALAEIRAAAKRTHWIWFIFPQIAGLSSFTATPMPGRA